MKSSSGKKNFHIPLPDETYLALRHLAEETRQPATQIARDAIEYWLRQQRKNSLHREIEKYALEHSGDRFDLDPDLETAGIEHLLGEEGNQS